MSLNNSLSAIEGWKESFFESSEKLEEKSNILNQLNADIADKIASQLHTQSWKPAIEALSDLAANEVIEVNKGAREYLVRYATSPHDKDTAREALRGIGGLGEAGISSLEEIVLNGSTDSKVRDEAVGFLETISRGTLTESASQLALLEAGRKITCSFGNDQFLRHQSILIMKNSLSMAVSPSQSASSDEAGSTTEEPENASEEPADSQSEDGSSSGSSTRNSAPKLLDAKLGRKKV